VVSSVTTKAIELVGRISFFGLPAEQQDRKDEARGGVVAYHYYYYSFVVSSKVR